MIFTGDDEGTIKAWDSRSNKCVFSFDVCSEYISDLAFQKHLLFSTSGDGFLSVMDVRKRKIFAQSDEDLEDEMLSLAFMKNGMKLLVGTQEGFINIFTWDYWGLYDDRISGHPMSVETILTLTDRIFCTGCSDGMIRLVQLHPNKLLGVVGEVEDGSIDDLCLSWDNTYLASIMGNAIKFWNIKFLFDDENLNEDSDEDEGQGSLISKKQQEKLDKAEPFKNFFCDL
eukprot:TRINITY_DN150_c0_g4_i2.p1 TRINITY_DN150_c0_g4~~TRINITY_DN150_c0_g4_i2.p1  ORF type:complete len:228 (-),score=49.62 TRINITY_DN150_c0_g4_i2:36-719(-)